MIAAMVRDTERELVHLYKTPEAPVGHGVAMDYSPDQPRDANGEWTDGGGGSSRGSGGEGSGGSSGGSSSKSNTHIVKQSKLTSQQHVEAKDYKEGGYRDLNNHLRNPTAARPSLAAEYDKQAATIQKAIDKSTLTESVTVYRGFQHPALAKNAEKVIGREIPSGAFLSTSRNKQAAADFAGLSEHAVLLKINAPAGTKALNMDQFETHGNAGEHELLFGKNSKFRVTGVDRSGRIPVIEGHMI